MTKAPDRAARPAQDETRGAGSDLRVAFVTESPTPYYTRILNALARRVRLDVIYLDRGRMLAQGTFEEVRIAVPQLDRQANQLGL